MMAPPRHIARLLGNARSSHRDTLWQFSFEFPAHFDTKFVMAGGTVPKLRNIVYMHVGPKMAPKCDFDKINANWVFSLSSYKYAYFYSQLLKLISFWFICASKSVCHKFRWKKQKQKVKKTKKYIRNSQNNLVDYIAHYHCGNFRGDRVIHGRDLKGGAIMAPPPSLSSLQNSPV